MADPDHERAVAQEWDRLETLVQAAGLLTDEVRRLFQSMRRQVDLYRKPGVEHLCASVPKRDFKQLMHDAQAVPPPWRLRIVQVTAGTSLGNLLSHLHNRALLESDVEDTRVLFGLDTPPTADFQLAAGMVSDALCSVEKTIELMRTCYHQAPARVREVADSAKLAEACASDTAVLCFIDRLARQVEELTLELLEFFRRAIYLPPRAPASSSGEEAEESDQRALRDFLHWLSLVMHRFRSHLVGVARHQSLGGIANVARELLEHSLWEGALLLMLTRRFPELFSPAAAKDDANVDPEERRTQLERFDALCAWVDVLVGQWQHLAAQRKKWKTGDLAKTHQHLSYALRSLHTLRDLELQAVHGPAPDREAMSVRRTSKLARPAAEHITLVEAPDKDTVVIAAKHIPGFTNLALASMWRSGARPSPPMTIILHHAAGRPCISPYSLVPLDAIFPEESALVDAANRLARRGDYLLWAWEQAAAECQLGDALAEMSLRGGIAPVQLLTHGTEECEVIFGGFALPASRVAGLLDPADLEPMPDDVRQFYAERNIRFPDEPVNWLWLVPPDADDLEEEPF